MGPPQRLVGGGVGTFVSTRGNGMRACAFCESLWVCLLVVADNLPFNIAFLQSEAGTLNQLHVLVLAVERVSTLEEWERKNMQASTKEFFFFVQGVEEGEQPGFDALFARPMSTAKPHLFLWGLCAFLRKCKKISSHLQAVGQELQGDPSMLAQYRQVVMLCCIFRYLLSISPS